MQIGKLNRRITIKTVTRVADGLGGYNETASTVKETWAGVMPLSARESLNYGLELGERAHEITIRYDGVINQTNYIEYGGRSFRIRSVVNPEEGRREYKLICTERTD
jgi:SPP1 family predicted phage head-tail adaptor